MHSWFILYKCTCNSPGNCICKISILKYHRWNDLNEIGNRKTFKNWYVREKESKILNNTQKTEKKNGGIIGRKYNENVPTKKNMNLKELLSLYEEVP